MSFLRNSLIVQGAISLGIVVALALLLVVGTSLIKEMSENESLTVAILDRDASIRVQAALIIERDKSISQRDESIRERDVSDIYAAIVAADDHPTPAEFEAYQKLARATRNVREDFLRKLIELKETRMQKQFPFALHAVVGLDTEMRDSVVRILEQYGKPPSVDIETNIACAELAFGLDDDSAIGALATANYVAALSKTTDLYQVAEFTTSLAMLDGELTDDQAREVVSVVIQMIKTEIENGTLDEMATSVANSIEADDVSRDPQFRFTMARLVRRLESMRAEVDVQTISIKAFKEQTRNAAFRVFDESKLDPSTRQSLIDAYDRILLPSGENKGVPDTAHAREWDKTLAILIMGLKKIIAPEALARVGDSQEDGPPLFSLTSALHEIGEKFSATQAAFAAQQVVAVLEMTNASWEFGDMEDVLDSFGDKVPVQQASTLTKQIVAMMKERRSNSLELRRLGHALSSFGDKLPAEHADAGVHLIVDAMKDTKTDDSWELDFLGRTVGKLGGMLTADQAFSVVQDINALIETETNSSKLDILGRTVGSLFDNLPAEQKWGVAQHLVTILDRVIGLGLGTGAGMAAAQKAEVFSEPDMDVLETFDSLVDEIGRVVDLLPSEQAIILAEQIVAAMQKTTIPWELENIGVALGSLGDNLPSKLAATRAKHIVVAMQETTNPFELAVFGGMLSGLGDTLTEPQAVTLASRIVSDMQRTTDPSDLAALGRALGSFGSKLPEEQATDGAKHIVEVMQKTTDSYALYDLGRALGSIGESLPAELAVAGALRIVNVMESTIESGELSFLGNALSQFGDKLPAAIVSQIGQEFLAGMEKTSDPFQLDDLGRALRGLGDKLPAEQTAAAAQRIVDVMVKSPTRVENLYSLGRTLSSFCDDLSEEHMSRIAQQLVGVMEKPAPLDAKGIHMWNPLDDVLGNLASKMDTNTSFSILKSVVCIGETRYNTLMGLEEKVGEKFDGNLWDAVNWVEGQGTDLSTLPRFPSP